MLVFESVAGLGALFSVRVGRWESVESTEEESSLVPAMLVTVSKNKTELGSFVGFVPKSSFALLKERDRSQEEPLLHLGLLA
jgi:hypothetical protein